MTRGRKLRGVVVTCLLLSVTFGVSAAPDAPGPEGDHRAWQHGVNLVMVGGKLLVVWGSAGDPPQPNLGGAWPHDVYYAWLPTPASPDVAPVESRILVAQPEAQEPPSVAVNRRGTILMTCEDGNGGINQHAGLWQDARPGSGALRVLRPYPFTIKRGGHSGHVAAMGDRFLATYGEGWVEGAGWRGLGTGKYVFARIIADTGALGREIKLTSNRVANPRDGWPLVAASDRNGLVVWQRYPELTLQAALIDASEAVVRWLQIIDGLPERYAYDVEFSSQLGSYVVAGSSGDGGFVALVSQTGHITKIQRGLPPMASESRIILGGDGSKLVGVYPIHPHGVAVIRLSADSIELARIIDHPYVWDYSGTTGTFVAPERVLFATLSTTGLRLISLDLRQ